MKRTKLTLDILPGQFAVCRTPSDAPVPGWAWFGSFASVTRTEDELSVVCAAEEVPAGITHTPGWRTLKVRGQLDFSLVGILAGLSGTLADTGVSIFANFAFQPCDGCDASAPLRLIRDVLAFFAPLRFEPAMRLCGSVFGRALYPASTAEI